MGSIREALRVAREVGRLKVAGHGVDRWPRPDSPAGRVAAESDNSSETAPPSPERFLEMSISEFRKADAVLLVRSAVLGEDIAIVSNEGVAETVADLVVYLIDEFRHLYATGELETEALRALHHKKKLFGNARLTGFIGRDGTKSGEV